ncbi:sister chromatid cohesion protein PDS5 homolog B-like [Trifolium pratense]|uniref:sister chromatid cohesion protein PDS5 homolog B-like n=1 Tax=Trifolium pratense TaxID=57577 RepID=UPI001E6923FA|nr:sister chromatid cohesion protein PDS5 homolog B-like [Trifolium pratense]
MEKNSKILDWNFDNSQVYQCRSYQSGISYMFDQMESLGDDDLTSLYSTSVQQILSIEDVTAEFISLNCQWNVPTILQSFGCIAQWSVSDLGSQVEEITSYICQKIIQMECLDNDDNDLTSLNGTSQCSKSCQLKIYELKTLVKCFLPDQRNQAKWNINGLLDILSIMLLESDGFVNRKKWLNLKGVGSLYFLLTEWL